MSQLDYYGAGEEDDATMLQDMAENLVVDSSRADDYRRPRLRRACWERRLRGRNMLAAESKDGGSCSYGFEAGIPMACFKELEGCSRLSHRDSFDVDTMDALSYMLKRTCMSRGARWPAAVSRTRPGKGEEPESGAPTLKK